MKELYRSQPTEPAFRCVDCLRDSLADQDGHIENALYMVDGSGVCARHALKRVEGLAGEIRGMLETAKQNRRR